MYYNLLMFKKYSKNRILISDDEEFCLNIMETMLQQAGIDSINRVDKCINGEEMVNYVQDSFENNIEY